VHHLLRNAQTYAYAMFFMNDTAQQQLDKADGFEVGVGPSVVVMDEGKAKTSTTTTPFGQFRMKRRI
jgi:hypothetical protein